MKAIMPKRDFRSSRTYQIVYEILNSLTHGIGTLVAVSAATLMLVLAVIMHKSPLTITALSLYSASIITFLLASTLFHALVFTRASKIFQFLDHSGIYLVILGSYTPYTWLFMPTRIGWTIWGIIAFLSFAGMIYDIFFVGRWPWLSTAIYLLMGWLIVLAFPQLHQTLTPFAFNTLLAGGITYSLGALVYLFPKIPMGHVFWHIFVLGGVTLMYISLFSMLFL